MKTNHHTPGRRMLLAFPTAVVVAALIAPSSFAATLTPATAAPQPTVQPAPAPATGGIIMRDGGICDPIRHMGC